MQVGVLSKGRRLPQSALKKGSSGNGVKDSWLAIKLMGRSGRPMAGAAAELDVKGAQQILAVKPPARQRLTTQLWRHRRLARSARQGRRVDSTASGCFKYPRPDRLP
jgi:hypothetical protein